MLKNGRPYFIDYQGARPGPIQYDLASLLIDPYVDLPPDIQTRLLADCLEQLTRQMDIDSDAFRRCFRFCCLTRNLQILGAFGHLTRVKRKPHFEKYIPAAVRTLRHNLRQSQRHALPELCELMDHNAIASIANKID